jgi:predicted DNA-binding transcriptional regulator YafY
MGDWTFVTNHALVLSFIARQPRITAREMANSIGITERTVRKIIADLDIEGYITKKKQGRGIRYRINPDLSLRHDAHREIAVGDFLGALGWRRQPKHSRHKVEAGV